MKVSSGEGDRPVATEPRVQEKEELKGRKGTQSWTKREVTPVQELLQQCAQEPGRNWHWGRRQGRTDQRPRLSAL